MTGLAGVAAAVAAALAGCGGGGGSAGDPLPVDVVPLAITGANYEAVGRQTTLSAGYLLDTGSLVSGAQVAPDARTLIRFARGQLARFPALLQASAPVVGGATITDVLPCTGGGSVTATVNDLSGNGTIDNGDSGRLVANNCIEGGATLSGTLDLAFSGVSGDMLGDVYGATVAVTLTSLRATTDAGNVSGSGSITLIVNSTAADRGTVDMRVPLLTMSGQVGGVADALTLQDWRVLSTTSPGANGPTVTVTASGTTISSALEGKSVSVVTGAPLVVLWGDVYPSSGQFTATGAAGSQVRVTALNASTARLELDAGGDGVYETSVDRAWTALN